MQRAVIIAAATFLLGATLCSAQSAALCDTTHASAAQEFSAAKRKAKQRSPGHQAYGRSRPQTQIACTPAGCNPIPPGCRVRPGMNPFTWDPSGFDEIVCPYR